MFDLICGVMYKAALFQSRRCHSFLLCVSGFLCLWSWIITTWNTVTCTIHEFGFRHLCHCGFYSHHPSETWSPNSGSVVKFILISTFNFGLFLLLQGTNCLLTKLESHTLRHELGPFAASELSSMLFCQSVGAVGGRTLWKSVSARAGDAHCKTLTVLCREHSLEDHTETRVSNYRRSWHVGERAHVLMYFLCSRVPRLQNTAGSLKNFCSFVPLKHTQV